MPTGNWPSLLNGHILLLSALNVLVLSTRRVHSMSLTVTTGYKYVRVTRVLCLRAQDIWSILWELMVPTKWNILRSNSVLFGIVSHKYSRPSQNRRDGFFFFVHTKVHRRRDGSFCVLTKGDTQKMKAACFISMILITQQRGPGAHYCRRRDGHSIRRTRGSRRSSRCRRSARCSRRL